MHSWIDVSLQSLCSAGSHPRTPNSTAANKVTEAIAICLHISTAVAVTCLWCTLTTAMSYPQCHIVCRGKDSLTSQKTLSISVFPGAARVIKIKPFSWRNGENNMIKCNLQLSKMNFIVEVMS